MSLIVDAHQHFWTYGTYQTSWMEAPPYTGDPAFEPLRRSFGPDDLLPEISRAARMPNVFAKLSGLDAGGADTWTAADIAPYIDRALELFGPDRLMFGSDWPVANLRGRYGKVWRETNRVLARLSRDERDRILGGTAIAFYRLPKAQARHGA
jgi:L-fuconolactonase